MKTDIKTLQDSFKIGLEAFEDSRNEAAEVIDLYHNRHYTQRQLAELADRGQPAETYNVIKQYSRMFVGYFSSVINTVKTIPRTASDANRSAMLSDTIDYILEENDWALKKDAEVLDMLHSGLAVIFIDVEYTGSTDNFGRKLYRINLEHVDPAEIILDPMSKKEDYSDARFIHRFKWITADDFDSMFGEEARKKADENYNFTEAMEANFEYKYGKVFTGQYRVDDNYLIIHTIVKDNNNKYQSIYWHGDYELDKQEVAYDEVKFPYLVSRTSTSNFTEYYGIFREIKESQKAIDQAVLAIQLMVNSQKIFIEPESVNNENEFIEKVKQINSVIPVLDKAGIHIEDMSQDIANQYIIIDKNLERIQRILSINDSFIGMASASDSGRKVKLQQEASVVALRYLTNSIEFMYANLGRAIVSLVKQYYRANQILSVANLGIEEERKWFEINKPYQMPTGRWLAAGVPEFELAYKEVTDPNDTEGPRQFEIINEADSDLSMADVRVKVETASYNDTDDIERIFIDSLIQGPAGQITMQASPGSYFRLLALGTESAKTRHSTKIAQIFKDIAQKLEPAPNADPRMFAQGNQPGGQSGSAPQLMSAAGITNFANPEQGTNNGYQ